MNELTETKKHQFCNEALKLKQEIEVDYLALGAMLMKIQDERLWEAGWESWDEYTMELKMSQGAVSRIINIYKVFVLQYEVPEKTLALAGGWSVVAEYLPMVKEDTKKAEVANWFSDASEMTRQDIRRTITEARKGIDMTKCKHTDYYILKICRNCGNRETITDTHNEK